MVICMKTTIQISDSLFAEARKIAHQEHTTLKALVEEGLRTVIAKKNKREPFKLREASFRGNGLQSEFADASGEKILNVIYEGHGSE